MKILAALFRLICALIVLLAVAVYLNGPLQATIGEYLSTFTPDQLLPLAQADSWLAIAAGTLLLLALCCGIKLGWNLVYSLATVVFFAEVAVLVLGPDMALPSPARGMGWEQYLRELPLNYPVPTLMVPALCILGCLCSSAPVRIAWTALYSCALCYGCAELLAWGVQHWQAMPEPFMPRALDMIKLFPWILLALPGVFFLQYCLFMALFETFMPHSVTKARKAEKDKQKNDSKKATGDKDEEKKNEEEKPAAASTVNVTPKAVVVKRPVVHKKKPISPAPSEVKADEAKPEAAAAAREEATPDKKAEPAPAAEKVAPGEESTPKASEAPEAPEAKDEPKATSEGTAEKEEKPATPAAE